MMINLDYFLQGCPEIVLVDTPNILSIDEWRGFWISYDYNTGTFELGKEGETAAFMTIVDAEPIDIRHLGYTTWGTVGYFKFCI